MKAWHRVAGLLFAVGWGANHFAALLLVYRDTLALGPSDPALVFGMYALGLVPGLLVSGPVSDRYGRPAIVIPAACGAVVASVILGALGDRFGGLLAGRLLYGIAAGAVMTPGAVWLIELAGDAARDVGARRATIALSAGFGFGPLVSGLLAQYAPRPTVLPYVVHVGVMIAAIVFAAGAPTVPRTEVPRGPLLRIGLDRTNRRRFVHGVAWMAPFVFAFPTIAFASLPAMLGSLGGAPIAYIGVLCAITLLAAVAIQPATLRFDPTTAARLGLVTGAVGAAVGAIAVAVPLSALLLVAAPILGAGYGICMTAGLRNVDRLALPGAKGGLTGLYYVLSYLGFAAPYLLAVATQLVAATTALGITAALCVLAAIALRAP